MWNMPSGHVKYSAAAECDDYSFQLGKRGLNGAEQQSQGWGGNSEIFQSNELLWNVKYAFGVWNIERKPFNVKYPTYVGCDDYSFRLGRNLKGKDPQAWETGAQQWNIRLAPNVIYGFGLPGGLIMSPNCFIKFWIVFCMEMKYWTASVQCDIRLSGDRNDFLYLCVTCYLRI